MRILYLDLDTTRPDHLGCYGYHRSTSPNIDRIAAQGVRFTNYYCTDAPCLPSRTALMSGRFGIHTGVVGHGGTAADMRIEGASRDFRDRLGNDALPAFLRAVGFRTVSISPFAERHSAWHFLAGFSEIHNTGRRGGESAEEVTPTALKWIRDNARQDDWFLQVNYWDPHTPYRAPAEFGNPFREVPPPAWVTEDVLRRQRAKAGPHGPCELNMYDDRVSPRFPRYPGQIRDRDDIKRFFDGYDCGIAYMDSHIGQIFQALEDQGVMDDLTIIISADHGENLGELGLWGEHATADHTTCRIPMILRSPGIRPGRVDEGLHYQIDLAPTLADLLGREPAQRWDGRSYAGALRSDAEVGREFAVLSQCAHVCQRGVRWGPWLYMRTYHCGYHLFPREMLFSIAEDPYEQHNLAAEQPALCRQGASYLMEWHDRMMSTMPYDVDPLWTVMKEGGPFHARGRLAGYCERLEATGRTEAAEALRRKYPGELKPGPG
jgi:arylsulfatase A-like enzyme